MSASPIDVLVLAVLLVFLVRLLPQSWRLWRLYHGIRDRRLSDGSAIAPPAPPAVAALAAHLGALGFERIGERTIVLPDGKRHFEWNLVDVPTTTYVSIVPLAVDAARMVCYSAFPDGAFADTSWPMGTPVTRSDLVAQVVPSSPADAVAAHARLVTSFAAAHGRPLTNRTMADLLERDATYRTRHGGATIRRRVFTSMGMSAITVVAGLAVLARLVLLDR